MSLPLRALLTAALSCVLVVAAPAAFGATGRGTQGQGKLSGRSPGISRSHARQVLQEARTLMRSGPPARGTRLASTDLTMALRDLYLARPALTGSDRQSADRLLSRSTAAARVQSVAASTPKVICQDHFCVHYAAPTTDAWAKTTWQTLEHVWAVEVPLMGRAPLSDGGAAAPSAENPDDRLDVYLQDLGDQGYYGYCSAVDDAVGRQVPAYCALDDDFARSQYGTPPLSSLRVTAAHEFFHAIQFAADVDESTWFMEGSATWAEDVVYDQINDNYQYLASSPIRHSLVSLDHSGGMYPYGSFIFFTYTSQRRGNAVVRRLWDGAVGTPTALQSIRAEVGTTAWPAFFTLFASWNTLPAHSYSERSGYPPPVWWHRKKLAGAHAGTGDRSVRIPHLASAALQLTPGAHLSPRKHLLLSIDAPPTSTGSRALLQRRYRDGRVTETMLTLSSEGNRRLLVPFNHRQLRSVAVVLANTAPSGSTHVYRVRATVR